MFKYRINSISGTLQIGTPLVIQTIWKVSEQLTWTRTKPVGSENSNYLIHVILSLCRFPGLIMFLRLYFTRNSNNGPMIFYYTQRRKWAVFYSMITYGCYFYLPHNFLGPKYTVRTEGIQITLYFITSSISLVKNRCFYK